MNSEPKLKYYDSMLNYVYMYSEGTLSCPPTSKSTQTQILEDSIDSLPPEIEVDEEVKLNFDNEMISGLWGLHRFENNQWSSQVRPVTRLKHFEKLKLTEKEKAGQLTKRMIACCLTYLERSPYDYKLALCKCQIPDKGIKDISALRSYHYLQYLNLSRNQITTLEALSEMPFLQYLDASNNYIENAFDFEAPLYLTTVNYSKNIIKRIPVLDSFWSIVNLDMSYNCIREIKGLQNLKFLVNLNLSYNRISFLENLSNLKLAKLNLSHNSISMVETEDKEIGFNTLSSLNVLDLSHNKLASCSFLQGNEWLEELYLNDNNINDLLEVYYFRYMTDLRILDLSNNKLCDNYHFKAICIRTLQKLCELNKQAILAEDRIQTATKEKISRLIPAHTAKVQLMLLEYLNKPKIGAHVCPYGENIPSIIVVVGPPASKKKFIVSKYIKHCEFLKLGLSYTTRPKKKLEVEGEDYYFVGKDKFVGMIRKAEFIAVSEFNGHLYGIHYSELEKAIDSILVFYSDLETALILKMAGVHPKLILAMPRSEKNHIKWIKETYFFDEIMESIEPEIKIQTCPASLKDVRVEVASEDTTIDEEEESDEIDQILDALSKQKIYESIKDTTAYTQRELLFKHKQSMISAKIDIDFESTISSGKKREPKTPRSGMKRTSSNERATRENVLSWKNYEDTFEDDDVYRKEMGLDEYLNLSEESTVQSVGNTEPQSTEKKSRPSNDNGVLLPEQEVETIPADISQIIPMAIAKLSLPVDDPATAFVPDPVPTYIVNPVTTSIRNPAAASYRDHATVSIVDPATTSTRESAAVYNVDPATASIWDPTTVYVRDPATALYNINHQAASVRDPATVSVVISTKSEFRDSSERVGSTSQESMGIALENDVINDRRIEPSMERKGPFPDRELLESEAAEEERSYDSVETEQRGREHAKSISNTHILRAMQCRIFDNPMLSALSATDITKEETKKTGSLPAKTTYMTLAERFDAFKADKLGPFVARIMLQRKELLNLHFENPGLFQTVIFTDDNPSVCIDMLKDLTKQEVKSRNLNKIQIDILEDNPKFKDYMQKKILQLKLFKSRTNRQYEDLDLM